MRGNTVKFCDFNDTYVVGAGKAAAAMAGALCTILRGKVAGGAINVPHGNNNSSSPGIGDDFCRIAVTHASHPVPDENGVSGTKKIVRTAERARKGDIVFVLISGGGSALMPLPARGLSLADKQQVTRSLLASGASIHEVNAVRKHLSRVKGGQLVRHAVAECRIVALILSDVVGDDPAVIASGPTCPDPSTFADALEIVEKYGIAQPARVARHLERGAKGMIAETPKPGDPAFERVHNFLIGSNRMACMAAARYLRRSGLRTKYLGSSLLGGPAHELGASLAALDLPPRSAAVTGGETTVRLGKYTHGKGGRNQEAAVAFALAALSKNVDVVAAFMGTDGIDGNSDAAGALVSPRVYGLAKEIGAGKYLARHDSYRALKKMGSLIFTGPTGTNVNDIAVLVNYRDIA
jgi:glycerate-2-kinase